MHAMCCAGNVLQYTQLASVLTQAGQYSEAEALLHELLLHLETVKVHLLCQASAPVILSSLAMSCPHVWPHLMLCPALSCCCWHCCRTLSCYA